MLRTTFKKNDVLNTQVYYATNMNVKYRLISCVFKAVSLETSTSPIYLLRIPISYNTTM